VGQVSVANVAVDLASSIFGNVAGFRVLLLGAGEMGEKSAKAFAGRGVTQLTVASRQPERAQQLAEEIGASAIRFEERESRLAEWDIVVCATSAPQTILSSIAIRAAMKERPNRPMLLVDLAMPRDVEETAAEASNVFLYNLDDLARISDKNRLARSAEAERGRTMLMARADSLWRQIEMQLGNAELGANPGHRPFGASPDAQSLVAFA
jgi:glutamyl-tRNA reductase